MNKPTYQGIYVEVHNCNIDKYIKKLKKKVIDSGLMMELQNRKHFVKPSVEKRLARSMAKKRHKRQLANQNKNK